MYRDISELEAAIARSEDTLDRLEVDVERANYDLNNTNLSFFERTQLLKSIRYMESQIDQYEAVFRDLETLLFERQRDLRVLKDYHGR